MKPYFAGMPGARSGRHRVPAGGEALDTYGKLDTISGFENVITGAGNDRVYGNHLANRIETGAGNDVIDGGGGADVMIGGAGDDTYWFEPYYSGPPTGAIIELAGGGIDEVADVVRVLQHRRDGRSRESDRLQQFRRRPDRQRYRQRHHGRRRREHHRRRGRRGHPLRRRRQRCAPGRHRQRRHGGLPGQFRRLRDRDRGADHCSRPEGLGRGRRDGQPDRSRVRSVSPTGSSRSE